MGVESVSSCLLLVDDSPEIGVIVERFSRSAGHQASSRTDVTSAWDYLSRTRPDLVVLDVNLPGESGLVLCRRIRAAPGLAKLPIAIFSHWDRPEDIAAGLRAGADFVLSKELLCSPDDWRIRVG